MAESIYSDRTIASEIWVSYAYSSNKCFVFRKEKKWFRWFYMKMYIVTHDKNDKKIFEDRLANIVGNCIIIEDFIPWYKTMILYHVGAVIKIILWAVILFFVINYIDPKIDPAIWLGFWFLGLFVLTRGVSFYLFLWVHSLSIKKNKVEQAKESYKLSVLFWMFVLLNVILLLLDMRTKTLWIVIFLAFVSLQVLLVINYDKQNELREF